MIDWRSPLAHHPPEVWVAGTIDVIHELRRDRINRKFSHVDIDARIECIAGGIKVAIHEAAFMARCRRAAASHLLA
jgi:hypothetical protein